MLWWQPPDVKNKQKTTQKEKLNNFHHHPKHNLQESDHAHEQVIGMIFCHKRQIVACKNRITLWPCIGQELIDNRWMDIFTGCWELPRYGWFLRIFALLSVKRCLYSQYLTLVLWDESRLEFWKVWCIFLTTLYCLFFMPKHTRERKISLRRVKYCPLVIWNLHLVITSFCNCLHVIVFKF